MEETKLIETQRVTFCDHGDKGAGVSAPKKMIPQSTSRHQFEFEKPNGLGLLHGPGGCPGFTGGEAKQLVRPRSFRQLLHDDALQVVIPLFQRKYCWEPAQGTKWFQDLRKVVKRNGWNGCHGTGKAIFKPLLSSHGAPAFICVDGQQRITTTSVLLMALRDALLREVDDAAARSSLEAQIHDLLWCSSGEGHDDSWKLLPSLADRRTYRSILLGSDASDLLDCDNFAPANTSLQAMKKIFDDCVSCALRESSKQLPLDILTEIFHQAVDEMYLVSVEIQNDPDLAQVFLWLQEKTLLGMGSLLENLAPGVEFHAADLVRNILFAPLMRKHGLGSEALLQQYQTLWLHPIELRAGCSAKVDEAIDASVAAWYVEREGSGLDPAGWVSRRTYVSTYEQRIHQTIEWFRSCGVLKYATDGIARYARFLTFVDDVSPTLAHGLSKNKVDIASPEMVASAILTRIAQYC
jgi:hypothetical protein